MSTPHDRGFRLSTDLNEYFSAQNDDDALGVFICSQDSSELRNFNEETEMSPENGARASRRRLQKKEQMKKSDEDVETSRRASASRIRKRKSLTTSNEDHRHSGESRPSSDLLPDLLPGSVTPSREIEMRTSPSSSSTTLSVTPTLPPSLVLSSRASTTAIQTPKHPPTPAPTPWNPSTPQTTPARLLFVNDESDLPRLTDVAYRGRRDDRTTERKRDSPSFCQFISDERNSTLKPTNSIHSTLAIPQPVEPYFGQLHFKVGNKMNNANE